MSQGSARRSRRRRRAGPPAWSRDRSRVATAHRRRSSSECGPVIGRRAINALTGAWSVDVVAVAPRADVALRIQRLTTQRARQTTRRDDLERPVHEGACRLEREPDLERVRSFELVVVDSLQRREELTGRRTREAFHARQVDDLALVLLFVLLRLFVFVCFLVLDL